MIDTTKLTVSQLNIANVYISANTRNVEQGMNWYQSANRVASILASKYSIELIQACAVIAVLSPMNSWANNIKDSETVCDGFAHDLDAEDLKTFSFKANVLKAYRILRGEDAREVVGGFKVRAFFELILDPTSTDWVCVDSHAINIAMGEVQDDKFKGKVFSSKKRYELFANDYRRVAELFGVTPSQLQAVTWVAWREQINGTIDRF